ncbi:MAG: prepilin-type N-terminal cleavage/methylation domain-containing protein [Candidatus Gastranaerophilaceae bacterium]
MPRCFAPPAFTLSEVLITLGIIGIVAALTIPSLINNATDRKYRGVRQKALATIGGAVRNITVTEGIGNAVDAEDFVENHLRKQIQIVKTCKNNDLRSCGIETNSKAITTLTEPKTKITMPKKIGDLASYMSAGTVTDGTSTSYGFLMSNGYSVNLFYNPNCLSDNKEPLGYGQDRVCVNAIYDMNGLARPNEVGKDIGFVTVIYPDIKVQAVAPEVYKNNAANATFDKAYESCKAQGDDLSVPNLDELLSMYYNMFLLGIPAGHYWSPYETTDGLGWGQYFGDGSRFRGPKSLDRYVRCVQR